MRNTLFAAAAAFALIVGTVPTFAADAPKTDTSQSQSQANQSTKSAECAAIMADQKSHTAAEVAKCQTQ